MKSRCLLMAAFALMLVSCAKDAESIDSTPIEKGNSNVVAQQPVSFGAYVNRATTRAGAAGELTNDGANGKVSLQDEGFGVFAYFTDDKPYTPDYNPNFMYNTQVTYDASANAWTYSPMRYWPNENSANDASEGIDRLSFFAYAPHVNVSPLTGMVDANDSPDSGIVYMNRNGAEGDPFVNYIVNFDPAKQVDFCWGTPQVDMTKPEVSDPVEFEFNHTLAALNVQIDALLDKVDPNTKIFVRSVSFEGFADRGSFNLNTPADKLIWYDVTGRDYIEGGKVTVYDGRTNGHEGSSEAVNELPNGLNPVIVQSAKYGETGLLDGVTSNVVNLFGSASNDAPILVIPTGQPLKVTIVYDVETLVPTLPGYLSDGVTQGTSVENNISKSITLNTGENIKKEAGKKYTLNLHLGLTSMNFDANVTDWDLAATVNGEVLINTVETIHVSSVSLDPKSLELIAGDSYFGSGSLTANIIPSEAANTNVSWTSSDRSVATVSDEGVVTAVAPGNATITVTTEDGHKTDECTVTVYAPLTYSSLDALKTAINSGTFNEQDDYVGVAYVRDDGSLSPIRAIAIGVIAYISTNNTDVDAAIVGSRILVMALDNNGLVKWSNAGNGGTGNEGYALGVTRKDDNTPYPYPAISNAWHYGSYDGWFKNGLTEAQGHWFLPSKAQMELMGAVDGSLSEPWMKFAILDYPYWCSTSSDDNKAYMYNTSGNWVETAKTESGLVRPVFAY